jgi:aspartyl-tRNA(Asn)/glutamyl-tRNA(Gln) amidotransferase subunit C
MTRVTRDDVRRVAELARLGLSEERLDALAADLSGILSHMEALGAAIDASAPVDPPVAASIMRPDTGSSVPLARSPSAFAPQFADGFFLVPRLASHGEGES